MSDSSNPPATISRRHDLDALRGIAMLLGIVLHGAIAFIPGAFFWPVRDSSPHLGFGLLNATIHGFRMPLFFLVSGFFTAMLWRKRGLRRLIEHRFQRIFLPLLLGMFTIVPATWIVPGVLSALDNRSREDKSEQVAGAPQEEQVADAKTQKLLTAASTGDVEGLNELLAAGVDVNGSDGEGNTALHAAIFFGRDEIVPILLDAGADQEAVNDEDDGRPMVFSPLGG